MKLNKEIIRSLWSDKCYVERKSKMGWGELGMLWERCNFKYVWHLSQDRKGARARSPVYNWGQNNLDGADGQCKGPKAEAGCLVRFRDWWEYREQGEVGSAGSRIILGSLTLTLSKIGNHCIVLRGKVTQLWFPVWLRGWPETGSRLKRAEVIYMTDDPGSRPETSSGWGGGSAASGSILLVAPSWIPKE